MRCPSPLLCLGTQPAQTALPLELLTAPHPLQTACRSQGVCLRNARVYGSIEELEWALSVNHKLIIGREAAKEFKFVKMCLIEVW